MNLYCVNFSCRYPTDTDKHMLATQTGLSRSQVGSIPCLEFNYYVHGSLIELAFGLLD